MPEPLNLNDPSELSKINPQIAKIVVGGNRAFAKTENPYAPATPYSYDPTGAENPNQNFERYYSHPSYNKLNFSPWRDNESLYNEKGSALGDVWRATKSAGQLAWTGFMSPLRSYSDTLSGDFLSGDQQGAEEMKYLNAIGSSTRKGAIGFTSNLITNSGYTIGLIGEMALETAALAAVTTASGGLAAPTLLARLGKGAKDFGKYAEGVEGLTKTAQALNSYSAAEIFWKGARGVANFVNPLENTANAYKAIQGAEELSKLAKASTTAGAFFRDVQMANLTLSESKLEGATAENDLKEELINDYRRQNNGKWPPEKELLAINQAASDAGFKTLAWNIPTIYLTNKITFEPLLKSFSKPSIFTLKNGLEVVDLGKKGIVEATFLNKRLASLKPKNLITAPLKYFKENLSEGIQESSQEIISGTAKDYYEAIYNNAAKQGYDYAKAENQGDNVWDALSKNVVDQFSGKGFETFASGFLMGGLVKPITSGISSLRNLKNSEYKTQKAAYAQATLAKLNQINNNPLDLFGNGILNFANGSETVNGQVQSETSGEQKDWQDFEDQNVMSNVLTALDNGAYGIYQEKLRAIKSMTPEAIKEAYNIDGQEVLSKIDKIIARSESVKENYEKWSDRYENPFNPRKYNKGTTEYTKEALGFVTWENAKKLAIFNESSFERNLQRIQSVSDDILQTKGLNKIGANDISLLFTPQTINSELSLLNNEIEILADSEVIDKAALKSKQLKFKKLQDFSEKLKAYYLGQVTETGLSKVSKNELKKAYENYVTHLANSQTEIAPIDKLNLDKSFQQLLDLHNLKQDNVQHAEAINIFANPEGFVDQYKRLNKVFSDLYENRAELNKKAVENTQSKIEDNAILNVLFERGFVLSPENVEKLLKNKTIPTEFYDQNARQVVTSEDPIRFQEFVDIITNYVEVTKPEPIGEQPVENDINDESWQLFLDLGEVTDETIALIANGIKSGNSTDRMTQMMGDSEIAKRVERFLNNEVLVPTVEVPQIKLNIDIVKKFDKVKTDKDLLDLENELSELMTEINIDQYESLGISAKAIEDKIFEKRQELSFKVTLDNLKVGDIVQLTERTSLGKVRYAEIKRVGKDYVKIEDIEARGVITTILEKNLKENIKLKYSESMPKEKTNATSQEVENVSQNITKQTKLTENRDELKAIMDEAYANEEKFEEDFINELGCK